MPCRRSAARQKQGPVKAPFVWFGGKRRVASLVWEAFGDVDNYVEPFAGSLAVLLGRPSWHQRKCETVNDADAYLANFWRALEHDPQEVAEHADWPVNETDLFSRHLWLVNEGRERLAKLEADPEWFDPKVAGWWVWGINAWIGSGWCSGSGPWRREPGREPQAPAFDPITPNHQARELAHFGDGGRGVNRQLPHLGDAGQGVNRQLPHLGDAGRAANRKLPHLGNPGQGVYGYFAELAQRLRRVRVCAGDWTRVVTSGALAFGDTVGIFLDPPYLGDVRTADLYTADDHTISHAVREWALTAGHDPRYRIVLAGYGAEHEEHMPPTWRVHAYSASAAYQTAAQAGGNQGNQANRHHERLWFSPGCLLRQPSLFDIEAA